jgi:hypothetical protein
MAGGKEIRAGKAAIELGLIDKTQAGLKRAQARLKRFAAGVARVGAVLTAASTAILAPLLAMTKSFAVAGDRLDKLSARTGSSVEALSAMGFAAGRTGSSLDALETAYRNQQKTVALAADGQKAYAAALGLAKVTAEELIGLSPEQQFKKIADGIAGLHDESMQTAAAMRIFGRSGTALLPLMKEGAKGIDAYIAKAHELRRVMSTEDAKAAAALTDAMGDLKDQLGAVKNVIGAALAPMLTDLLLRSQPIIAGIIDWVAANKPLVVTILKVAAVVGAVGAGLLVVAGVVTSVSFAIGAFGAALATIIGLGTALAAALLSPIGAAVALALVLDAGLVAAGVAFLKFTAVGRGMASAISFALGQLWTRVTEVFQGIWQAIAKGDLALAGDIAMKGLEVAWATGLLALRQLWSDFGVWTQNFITDLVAGIRTSFNAGIIALVSQVQGALNAINFATGGRIGGGVGDFLTAFREELAGVNSEIAAGAEETKAWRDAWAEAGIGEMEDRLAKAKAELKDLLDEAAKPSVLAPEPGKARTGTGLGLGLGMIGDTINKLKRVDVPDFATSMGTFSGHAAALLGRAGVSVEQKSLDKLGEIHEALGDIDEHIEELDVEGRFA